MEINTDLVRRLLGAQFPQWADLPVTPVVPGGWCNRTFRLGDHLLARLPRHQAYAPQADKEALFLPRLAPHLPFEIPQTLALGEPGEGFLWRWSVCRWIDGDPPIDASVALASDLARFLNALHATDPEGGPIAGPHSFFRGGALSTYDEQTRDAIGLLKDRNDAAAASKVWDKALESQWHGSAVWVHGDLAIGNLLVRDGRLAAVIDFGNLAIGDPACDLAIAWMLFDGESRKAFKDALPLDQGTWARGVGWTLWKALIVYTGLTSTNAFDRDKAGAVLNDLLAEF